MTLASANTFSESEDFTLRSDDVLSRCVEQWPRTMEKGLGEGSSELAQDRASARDVVNAIGDAGSTHPG